MPLCKLLEHCIPEQFVEEHFPLYKYIMDRVIVSALRCDMLKLHLHSHDERCKLDMNIIAPYKRRNN